MDRFSELGKKMEQLMLYQKNNGKIENRGG